jgi:hypothetical protein
VGALSRHPWLDGAAEPQSDARAAGVTAVPPAPFYYYRDKDQKEIDVPIVRDGRVYPVEIKKTAQPGRNAVRHFSVLGNLGLEPGAGAVICLVPERLPITALVEAIPAWEVA